MSQPNIIFIITDQQRGDCLGVEDHPVLMTPTMDDMAARGVRFTRFYSACPSCIATRRSILSGMSPQATGLVGYQDGVQWNPPATLPGILAQQGYQTGLVGRSMHQHPPEKHFGFGDMTSNHFASISSENYNHWLEEVGPKDNGGWFGSGVMHNDHTASPWPLEEHLHFTNWTMMRSLRWLKERDQSKPFFLTIGFIAPHPPLQPPAFYMDRYIRTGVPDPVIGNWASPPEFGKQGDSVAPNHIDLKGEALLSAKAAYYGLINHVDNQLRRLLNPVSGLDRETRENTIVVFTSDHGEMLGDHYRWRKSLAYEAAARVPFIMHAPERFGINRASTIDAVTTHADIMPTLLDMVGIDIPDHLDGQSLMPLIRGEQTQCREYLHIEHAPEQQALTDGREKYIWFPAEGGEQFFDLINDPNECHNLASDSKYANRVTLWRERLIKELAHRPEGFSDGKSLIAGRPYDSVIPERS